MSSPRPPGLFTSDIIDDGLTGMTAMMADVIVSLGELGVAVLVFIETVFPPIPSELVLSLAGYLAERGRMNVVAVVAAATIGSLLGALVLYGLGAWLGEERAKRWVTILPLVDRSDVDKASDWFHRYGLPVVFFGRFIPIVRSLVSLPAGAARIPLIPFLLLTALGSGLWNTVLVGAGYVLGTQYHLIEDYTGYFDYVIFAAVAVLVIFYVLRKIRASKARPDVNG